MFEYLIENPKTLYKFVLDKETGTISTVEITKYKYQQYSNGVEFLRYGTKSTTYYCCFATDLDAFRSGRVYSFNPDVEHARQIMIEALQNKYKVALDSCTKFQDILQRMGENV